MVYLHYLDDFSFDKLVARKISAFFGREAENPVIDYKEPKEQCDRKCLLSELA